MKKVKLTPVDMPLASTLAREICDQFVDNKLAPEIMMISGMIIAATGETILKCLKYDEGSIDESKAYVDGFNVHQEEAVKKLYRRLNGED